VDRLIENLRALVLQAIPALQYALLERYTVVSCNPLRQTVDVRSQSTRVPDLTQVPLRAPGLALDLLPGTQVRVGWDADGAAYAVVAASGGLSALVPASGSGVKNNIDAGYVVVIQNVSLALLQPLYFPAGVAGAAAAEAARAAAVLAGNTAFVVHLSGGRVMPDAWTVP
jgi:hypothetical protein